VAAGRKTGGRTAGTQNKATKHVKHFLEGVFTEAFEDPTFRVLLIRQIVTLQIDSKLLQTLLAYYAGKPPQAHDHSGSVDVNLARIIAGPLPSDTPDPDDDEGAS
jgi:hypothetical protein